MLRARKWMASGSAWTIRARTARARMVRLQVIKRAVGAKAGRLLRSGILPAMLYGSEIVGKAPPQVKQIERLAGRALGPSASGTSLRAKLLWHRGPTDHATCTSAVRLAAEIWRAAQGDPRALPLAGAGAALTDVWQVLEVFEGTWRDAEGPIHTARLEFQRFKEPGGLPPVRPPSGATA